ncbi:protein RER1B-like [Brassica napus]|nr:protein RER1B-like [Brassica napus]
MSEEVSFWVSREALIHYPDSSVFQESQMDRSGGDGDGGGSIATVAVDPELDLSSDAGASLPTRGSDEFKPFIRRLPEFKFWYSMTKAFCIAFLMTFFSVFDVPVFWPILLCYWVVLFFLTMRRQISHMIKHKYIPFSIGKHKYSGRRSSASSGGASRAD